MVKRGSLFVLGGAYMLFYVCINTEGFLYQTHLFYLDVLPGWQPLIPWLAVIGFVLSMAIPFTIIIYGLYFICKKIVSSSSLTARFTNKSVDKQNDTCSNKTNES